MTAPPSPAARAIGPEMPRRVPDPTGRTPSPCGWWRRLTAGALLAAAAASPHAAGGEASAPGLRVEHAAGAAVYLGGGEAAGIEAGDRLEVHRDGTPVALLEVVRATEHSAFCRIVHEFLPVEPGDLVIESTYDELTVTEDAEPLPPPEVPDRLPRIVDRIRRGSEIRTPSVSGSVTLRSQVRETADGGTSRRWHESTARISVAGRDLGGKPYTFRIRARGRERSRDFGDGATTTDQRIYELSLRWEPTGSRTWWQVGRIGSRQEVGAGYLDGLAAQWGIGERWGIGGFAGLHPEVDDDVFSTSDRKAGLFVTWTTPRGVDRYGEILLSAIGEYVPEGLDREYLYLQSRFGNRGRWSIYQQAEIDVNRGWRREAGEGSTELSNVSISASVRLSERLRGTLSYDARRRVRDDDTRDLPEEAFDRLLREGTRGTLYFRGRSGLSVSVGVGFRSGEGDVDSVDSLLVSASHGNFLGRRLLIGGDYSTFSGDTGSGSLLTLRARKIFRPGHDVGLTWGRSTSTSSIAGDTLDVGWVRVDGTVQLPYRLFLLAEVEVGLSESAETRQMLQLGARF